MATISNKISEEVLATLKGIDPTDTNKYVPFMSKVYLSGEVTDFDVLRNTVEEFNVFLNKRKTKTTDISEFKTFAEMQDEVDELNDSGDTLSLKELETSYETVMDNENMLICCPFTHEASRKLGLTEFAYRDGGKDSAWCTTYKSPDHFNDYYYKQYIQFYYVKVRSEELKKQIAEEIGSGDHLYILAFCLDGNNGKMSVYDANDKSLSDTTITKLGKILNLSWGI